MKTRVAPLSALPQPPGDKWRPVGGRAGWEGWDPATSKTGTSCDSTCHAGNDPVLTAEYCSVARGFLPGVVGMVDLGLMDKTASDNWPAFEAECKKLLGLP